MRCMLIYVIYFVYVIPYTSTTFQAFLVDCHDHFNLTGTFSL